MNINRIITNCHKIAKSHAPKKSRNLVDNAIKITKRHSNGFTINYSYVNAYYIEYVEEGTKNKDGSDRIRARKFIAGTVTHISDYLYAINDGQQNRYMSMSSRASNIINRDLYNSSPDYRKLIQERSYEMINKRYYEESG